MRSSFAGYVILFLMLAICIGVNLGQHLLESLHIERNYVLITLIALTMAGLLVHRKMFFIVLVAGLTAAANLPEETLSGWHLDRVSLIATLLALVLMPLINKQLGLDNEI